MAERNADFITKGATTYLHLSGFLYIRKSNNALNTFWVCRHTKSCRARAAIDKQNGEVSGTAFVAIFNNS